MLPLLAHRNMRPVVWRVLWFVVLLAMASAQDAKPPLTVGIPVTEFMGGGQTHVYPIALEAGQFLHVEVQQEGIDIILSIFGPDGKEFLQTDTPDGSVRPETLVAVATTAGTYQVKIKAGEKEAPTGRYRATLVALRAATDRDRAWAQGVMQNMEAIALREQGKFADAAQAFERAQKTLEPVLGAEHGDIGEIVHQLAIMDYFKGDFRSGLQHAPRALAIKEKAFGPDSLEVAIVANLFAVVQQSVSEFEKAEALYRRAFAIKEKLLKPDHPEIAMTCINFGEMYSYKGDFKRAEPLLLRALAIWEKSTSFYNGYTAYVLNDLAYLHRYQGNYVEAENYFLRAIAMLEKSIGTEHSQLTIPLQNLGAVYQAKGDYAKAEQVLQRALAMREKLLGPDHTDVAGALVLLSGVYRDRGDYAQAEPLLKRALAIREKALGPQHRNVAAVLTVLGGVYRLQKEYDRAQPVLQRALSILEKELGLEHPDMADALHSLAMLYTSQKKYAEAVPTWQRVVAIREKSQGPQNPNLATALNHLMSIAWAQGDVARALELQTRACGISERNLALNIASGSERQKLAYLATLTDETDRTYSLALDGAPQQAPARDLALNLLLQRKGRALDAMTDTMALLRRRADATETAAFDELQAARGELAQLVMRGPQRTSPAKQQERIATLEAQIEKLEDDLSRRHLEFRAQSQPITTAAIQAAIPADATLVEFFVYRPFQAQTFPSQPFAAPRYAAYVLHHTGTAQAVVLGEVSAIDEAVKKLRQALSDPRRQDVKALARKVDQLVMNPLRAALGATRQLLLSPDGALNLVPFAALVDEQNQYLVSRYSISYLTSGRDLLRLQTPLPSKQEAVIVANPAFGPVPNNALLAQRGFGLKSDVTAGKKPEGKDATKDANVSRAQLYFPPLPGTASEAQALRALLPQATLLTNADATKAALKQLRGPRLLHIATHGFFLENVNSAAGNARGFGLPVGQSPAAATASNPTGAEALSPLLRSGLALAGANTTEQDGVLTALEAAGLDLWGTRLVVLSACDTGVGEVRRGEGVYGLRRALVLAGAESQVMSLWPVSDTGTRDLMIAYYQGLQRNEGRGEALRQVQLRMLKMKGRQHPYFWASFIQSGEWANLAGKR